MGASVSGMLQVAHCMLFAGEGLHLIVAEYGLSK